MGKTWKNIFSYEVQILVRENEWHTKEKGQIVAKDGNDFFKKISKQLKNEVFERIIIETGPCELE